MIWVDRGVFVGGCLEECQVLRCLCCCHYHSLMLSVTGPGWSGSGSLEVGAGFVRGEEVLEKCFVVV